MAHELSINKNGQAEMFYCGEEPWHGLGTKLDNPATAAEAIAAARLDWQAERCPIFTADGIEVPGKQAIVRDDTRQVLGVVGDWYKPVQNVECFDFLDSVVADGRLRYHTAGALGVGERIWLLAKLPGEIRVAGTDDITEKYLLLHNSHNGTSALRCFFTPVRVVCANTLALANRQGQGEGVTIRHCGDIQNKVIEAQHVLGLAVRFYDEVEEKITAMAAHKLSVPGMTDFFKSVYPDPEKGPATRAQNVRAELHRLFEGGKGQDLPGVRHSLWAAVNAVTEYVDHYNPSISQEPGKRLESVWFGTGSRQKARAWDTALDFLVC